MTCRRFAVAVSLLLLTLSPGAGAAEDARQIMQEVQRRTTASSYRYEGNLQVFDPRGRISEKRWTFERLGSHGQSRAVLRFTAPPDVRGVTLLIVNHPNRASDQWMWTPAIQRDRRIALQDRSTRFFGTDFSFEDLEERDTEQYEYAMEGDDTVDGVACWTIRSTPRKTRASQYSHTLLWVRKGDYALARIESYAKGKPVRRLDYSNIESIQGIWTARQLDMTDLLRGSRTRLRLDNVQYNLPMNEGDFTVQALRRQ